MKFPKPGKKVQPAVRIFADGREVCNLLTKSGRDEYSRRKSEMHARQNGLCSLCGEYVRKSDMTFEHSDGRGHGGGHRDDRIIKDGLPYNSVAHAGCNVRKGSKRLEQFLDEIIP